MELWEACERIVVGTEGGAGIRRWDREVCNLVREV